MKRQKNEEASNAALSDGRQLVNKKTYSAWEKKMIDTHWKTSTSRFIKGKAVLFAFEEKDLPKGQKAHANMSKPRTKLDLWHIGKGEMDSVSYGSDGETFKFPALDTGGLTNAVYRPGTDFKYVRFEGKTIKDLYAQWKRLSGKETFRGGKEIFAGLKRWLCTVHSASPRFRLAFWSPPREERVILKCSEAEASVGGEYYVRVFGKGDDSYARRITPAERKSLYIGISSSFVTPNLNQSNLSNEYEKLGPALKM